MPSISATAVSPVADEATPLSPQMRARVEGTAAQLVAWLERMVQGAPPPEPTPAGVAGGHPVLPASRPLPTLARCHFFIQHCDRVHAHLTRSYDRASHASQTSFQRALPTFNRLRVRLFEEADAPLAVVPPVASPGAPRAERDAYAAAPACRPEVRYTVVHQPLRPPLMVDPMVTAAELGMRAQRHREAKQAAARGASGLPSPGGLSGPRVMGLAILAPLALPAALMRGLVAGAHLLVWLLLWPFRARALQ